jgi:hypothetical protein
MARVINPTLYVSLSLSNLQANLESVENSPSLSDSLAPNSWLSCTLLLIWLSCTSPFLLCYWRRVKTRSPRYFLVTILAWWTGSCWSLCWKAIGRSDLLVFACWMLSEGVISYRRDLLQSSLQHPARSLADFLVRWFSLPRASLKISPESWYLYAGRDITVFGE